MKEHSMDMMNDRKLSSGASVSNSYNNANIGRPFSGHGKNSTPSAPKYDLFGSAGIGGHFGRSGSPKGKSPRK